MNHESAVQTLAVESYLLGEMPPGEREEFEQHFFECPECAQDMRDAMQLMAAASQQPVQTAVARGAVTKKKWFAWLQPQFAAGAIAVLAAACILEGIFIPGLRSGAEQASAPRVVASAFLVPQTRGADKVVKAAAGAPVVLLLDLPDSAAGPLQFVLKTQEGQVEFRMRGDAPPAGQSVTLSIPRMDLPPGSYMLVVEAPAATGQDGQEISRYPFELQRP